jgi:hypothetical protein
LERVLGGMDVLLSFNKTNRIIMTNNKQLTHTCVFEKSKTSNSNEAKCKYCNIVRYTIDVKFNNETYGNEQQ